MTRSQARYLALALLLLFFARLVHTARHTAVTFDEIIHLLDGAYYWYSSQLYSIVQNPPLINAWLALPLRLAFAPILPPPSPVSDWLTTSREFMWQSNANGLQLIFAGRLMIILLAVNLGAWLFQWLKRSATPAIALLALLFFTFDPNLIAHSALATTDLGATWAFFVTAYAVWRYWQTGNGRSYLLAGLAIGLALSAKFSGIMLFPALALFMAYRWLKESRTLAGLGRAFAEGSGWLAVALLVLFSVYRFQMSVLRLDFAIQQAHQLTGHSAFLWGQLSREGWWYYFPVLFLTKTPLALLGLIVLGAGELGLLRLSKQPNGESESRWWPLVLAATLFAVGLTSRVNIGYRYLLPILPLLMIAFVPRRPRLAQTTAVLALLLLLPTWRVQPDYLAYFNELAGGVANGWRIAVDSNFDWGQDLDKVAPYMQAHGLDTVNIAWFGTAPLSTYGINGRPITGWPNGAEEPLSDWFNPDNPAPGTYVLSVTQLQGVYLDDPARFHWFLARPPEDKIGASLFVYTVPAEGEATSLALAGIGLRMIAPADFAALSSNNVRPLWFDARSSFVWPFGQGAHPWLAVGDGHRPTHPALQSLYPAPFRHGQRTIFGAEWAYTLYQLPSTTDLSQVQPPAEPATFNQSLALEGWQSLGASQAGRPLDLFTYWQVVVPPVGQPKIFLHLEDASGQIVAQADGLDVQMAGLQPGDCFAQLHTLFLPDLPAGEYTLYGGLYDPVTAVRWTTAVTPPSDRILITHLQITP